MVDEENKADVEAVCEVASGFAEECAAEVDVGACVAEKLRNAFGEEESPQQQPPQLSQREGGGDTSIAEVRNACANIDSMPEDA